MRARLPFQELATGMRLISMWKWPLQKLFRDRDRIARDLGYADMERPLHEHLDDLLTMLLRMVVTLSVAVVGCFCWATEVIRAFMYPVSVSHILDNVPPMLDRIFIDPKDMVIAENHFWLLLGLIISVPLLAFIRTSLRGSSARAGNFNSLK